MADQRVQATEDMVGAGHATKADSLNRRGDVEHENDGTHKQATMEAQITPSTPATDHGIVYFKLVGGVPELHVLDDEGNETQITSGGNVVVSSSDARTKDNIALNAFRIAVNGSLTQFAMVDGIVDEFEDESAVDTAGSTNEFYDATNDLYSNKDTDVTSGETITESGHVSTDDSTKAIDVNTSTKWRQTMGASEWLKLDFGAGDGRVIEEYTIVGRNGGANQGPKDWTLEGSNNDSDWTTLDTRTGETTWNSGEKRTYTFTNSTSYRYYRLLITDNNGDPEVTVVEWELVEIKNMTLLSNAFTAEAVPAEARIVMFEENVDTLTVNTDIKAHASRDGGTTHTQITLTDEGDYQSGRRILSGQIAVSGQPSGTSMKWKVETLNTKEMKLHGISLSWQ